MAKPRDAATSSELTPPRDSSRSQASLVVETCPAGPRTTMPPTPRTLGPRRPTSGFTVECHVLPRRRP